MNKSTLVLLAVMLVPGCFAADPPQPPMDIRVVEMKHMSGDRLVRLVQTLNRVFPSGGQAHYDSTLNVVVLRGTPQQLTAVEGLLRKADVPGQANKAEYQVQLRVHLVAASPDEAKNGPLSPEIVPAVEQMRKTFSYKGYRQLDVVLVQVRNEASAKITGSLPSQPDRKDMASFDLQIENVSVADSLALTIRDFQMWIQIPVIGRTFVRTNITLEKGQKVVVGKLSGEQADEAIFLVLAADVQ